VSIIVGAVAGVTRAVVGYLRNSAEEDFEAYKFLRTTVLSAILGAIAGIYITDLKLLFASVFTGAVIIEDLLKGALKHAKAKK